MPIPIETIIAVLIVEMRRSLTYPGESALSVPVTLFWLAALVAFCGVLAVVGGAWAERGVRSPDHKIAQVVQDYRIVKLIQRAALLAAFAAFVHFCRWPAFISDMLLLPDWCVLDDVLLILPFVAAVVVSWLGGFHGDKMVVRRQWSMREYLAYNARYSLLLVLIPWLILKGVDDSRVLWPEYLRSFSSGQVVEGVTFILVLGAAAIYMPLFLKWLFDTEPMPASEIRWRLESLCRRAGLGFRDVLVWRTGGARNINAAVMGVFPRHRYVLFSDTLLNMLTPEECEAVLGHEIGHVQHKHILKYLVFTVGFVFAAFSLLELFPPDYRNSYLFATPIVVLLVCVYWRYVFGFLSRRFERQADLASVRLLGSPVPLTMALEKIATLAGGTREVKSWRHYSIAKRVRFLYEHGADLKAIEEYNAGVARVVRRFALVFGALVAFSVYSTFNRPTGLEARARMFEEIVATDPGNIVARLHLGAIEAQLGHVTDAVGHFREVVALYPGTEEAEEAERKLRKLGLPPGRADFYVAEAHASAGLRTRALGLFNIALERAPDDPVILAGAAEFHLRKPAMEIGEHKSDLMQAVQFAERSLALHPNARAYAVLAEAFLLLDRPGRANTAAREGLLLLDTADELRSRLLNAEDEARRRQSSL